MIARVWKGAVRKRDGDAYARYMQGTGVAGYARSPGNRGVWMLRPTTRSTPMSDPALPDRRAARRPGPATGLPEGGFGLQVGVDCGRGSALLLDVAHRRFSGAAPTLPAR
jgi:hypothetical protein